MSTKKLLFMEDLYDFYLNKYKKSTHFSSEKNGEPLVVQVHGKVNFDNSNKDKDGLLPVHLQACHTDLNANGSNIDKKVMESALPSFSNRPILAYIHKVVTDENPEGQWEFYTHNMHEDENGELVYDEYPIGIVQIRFMIKRKIKRIAKSMVIFLKNILKRLKYLNVRVNVSCQSSFRLEN